MRGFVGIDLGREPDPDETTVCKFRHLLERHGLGKRLFVEVNGYLDRHGLKIGTGTIVDATILHAPCSTKNKSGKRDPEMHQVKMGNQAYQGQATVLAERAPRAQDRTNRLWKTKLRIYLERREENRIKSKTR